MAKPRKVEQPAIEYNVTPKLPTPPATSAPGHDATPTVRHADDATFRKTAEKVFKTRRELFRKLAQ